MERGYRSDHFRKYFYNIVSTWTMAVCCSWRWDMAWNNLVVVVAVGQSHAFPICFDGQVMSLSIGARQIGRNEMEVTLFELLHFCRHFFCLTPSHSVSFLNTILAQPSILFHSYSCPRKICWPFVWEEPEIGKKWPFKILAGRILEKLKINDQI